MDNTFLDAGIDFFQELLFVLSCVEAVVFQVDYKLVDFVLFLAANIKEVLDALKVLGGVQVPSDMFNLN